MLSYFFNTSEPEQVQETDTMPLLQSSDENRKNLQFSTDGTYWEEPLKPKRKKKRRRLLRNIGLVSLTTLTLSYLSYRLFKRLRS